MTDIQSLLKTINKQCKKDVVQIGIHRDDPRRLSTGIFQLDLAMGGGFPEGRVSVVYGTESSMKTTVCLKAIAREQRVNPDKRCVFVDVEGTFTGAWAKQLGVDTDSLVYVQPANAEQAVDVIEALTYADDVSLVVVDSLAAMVTQHELDSPSEKAMVGVQGLLINKFYRKISRSLSTAHDQGRCPTLILINQIRFKVGVMMGNPETMPGGPSFSYASSMTVRLYGKDEMDKTVHQVMPAFKRVSVVLKKWKVPIAAKNCEFVICTIANEKLKLPVGASYDLGSILHYLKSFNLLVKGEKSGWILSNDDGEIIAETKTLDAMESKIANDQDFCETVKQVIYRVVANGGDLLAPE